MTIQSNVVQSSSSPWIPKFGVSFPCLMNVYVFDKWNSPHFSSRANDRKTWPPNVGIQGDDELCTTLYRMFKTLQIATAVFIQSFTVFSCVSCEGLLRAVRSYSNGLPAGKFPKFPSLKPCELLDIPNRPAADIGSVGGGDFSDWSNVMCLLTMLILALMAS